MPENPKQKRVEETLLEINLSALAHNYQTLRLQAGEGVKFMSVIKAYAYGNDSVSVAKKLEELGTDYFAVAYTEEGVRLRKAGITKPIMVFHPQLAHLEDVFTYALEPSLYGEYIFQKFIEKAKSLGIEKHPVHLKFNTGMNRLGFTEEKIETLLQNIKKTAEIKVVSLFSHLAASEDWKEREFTLKQIHGFRKMAYQITKHLNYQPLLHICNTSAIFNYPEATFSMVRSGLGLYGFGSDKAIDAKLKPIGTLKTVISQIQHLKEGDTVGYGRIFKAKGETRIANLPLGYADGISRNYGQQEAGVFIKGHYAPIVGNVCMDIIMVNVSHIECKEGDEVIVFGGPQHAASLAKAGKTIPYELITGISQRVERKIIP